MHKRSSVRRISILTIFIILVLFTSFSGKVEPEDKPGLAYSEFEKKIRDKYDFCAVFRWDQYAMLLQKLKEERFVVLPLNEMRKTFDSSKIIVGLRHDVDMNPFKALEMAKLENTFGIRSTFYFLSTVEYFGNIQNSRLHRSPAIENLLLEVHKTGAEIGIHNDLLTVMMIYKLDPLKYNREELEYYKSLRIPVYGSASHGSYLGKKIHISCFEIFSDFNQTDSIVYEGRKYPLGKHSMKDYGFSYEAYKIPFNKYFSESGGKWNDPEDLAGVLRKLDECKPGDRVQILVHPDWWGKQ